MANYLRSLFINHKFSMSPLFESLCPVYVQREFERPDQIGTAVLLQFGPAVFLLTAAHVADEAKNGRLMIPSKDGIVGVIGTLSSIELPRTGRRCDDKIDIACIRLDEKFAERLESVFEPLRREALAIFGHLQSGDHYTFGGFPWRKTKTRGKTSTTELCTYTGEAETNSKYEKLDYSPAYNILVRFRRKKSINFQTGHKSTPPLPHGISGGGIFVWQKDIIQNPRTPEFRLCGIVHTYLEKQHVLIGTRLGPYLALIERNWPELVEESGEGFFPHCIGGSFVGYRRSEWEQILLDARDSNTMHSSWEEWRHAAEKGVEEMAAKGIIMFIIELSAEEIREYCRLQGIPNTGHARSELASSRLAEDMLGIELDPSKPVHRPKDWSFD
ncbi:MAG: hypothetical protein AAGA58_04015 [Verrucomicrobiota bacterium]